MRMRNRDVIRRVFELGFSELIFEESASTTAAGHLMDQLPSSQPLRTPAAAQALQLLTLRARKLQPIAKPFLGFLDTPEPQLPLGQYVFLQQ